METPEHRTLGADAELATPANTGGTSNPDALIDHLLGAWVMTGVVDNEAVINDVYADRILNRQYLRIHQVSRKTSPNGQPDYEAWIHIAWDQPNEEFAVMWLDNTATTNFSADGVGHGKPEGDQIPFVWKLAVGSGIRNVFSYDRSRDSWEWRIDNVDKDQKSSPFARLNLKRK